MNNTVISQYSDDSLMDMAKGIAKSITVRWGNSNMSRDTTEPERTIIQNVVYGALQSARSNVEHPERIDCILYTAECILDNFIPTCNGYETIFIDLNTLLIENRAEHLIEVREETVDRLTYRKEVL